MVTDAYTLASGVRYSAIGYRLSAIGYRLSAIGYRLSAMGDWLSAIGYRLSAIAFCFGALPNAIKLRHIIHMENRKTGGILKKERRSEPQRAVIYA